MFNKRSNLVLLMGISVFATIFVTIDIAFGEYASLFVAIAIFVATLLGSELLKYSSGKAEAIGWALASWVSGIGVLLVAALMRLNLGVSTPVPSGDLSALVTLLVFVLGPLALGTIPVIFFLSLVRFLKLS